MASRRRSRSPAKRRKAIDTLHERTDRLHEPADTLHKAIDELHEVSDTVNEPIDTVYEVVVTLYEVVVTLYEPADAGRIGFLDSGGEIFRLWRAIYFILFENLSKLF